MFESLPYLLYPTGLFLSNFIVADLYKNKEDSWIKGSLDGIHTEILGSAVDRTYDYVKNKLKKKTPESDTR